MSKQEKPKFKYNKVRAVTLPLYKPTIDQEFYVRFNEVIVQAKDSRTDEEKASGQNEPPMLANVTVLDTGEEMQLIIPAVLQAELSDNYENDGYVGKCFALTKLKKKDGKRYHNFSVIEIEPIAA